MVQALKTTQIGEDSKANHTDLSSIFPKLQKNNGKIASQSANDREVQPSSSNPSHDPLLTPIRRHFNDSQLRPPGEMKGDLPGIMKTPGTVGQSKSVQFVKGLSLSLSPSDSFDVNNIESHSTPAPQRSQASGLRQKLKYDNILEADESQSSSSSSPLINASQYNHTSYSIVNPSIPGKFPKRRGEKKVLRQILSGQARQKILKDLEAEKSREEAESKMKSDADKKKQSPLIEQKEDTKPKKQDQISVEEKLFQIICRFNEARENDAKLAKLKYEKDLKLIEISHQTTKQQLEKERENLKKVTEEKNQILKLFQETEAQNKQLQKKLEGQVVKNLELRKQLTDIKSAKPNTNSASEYKTLDQSVFENLRSQLKIQNESIQQLTEEVHKLQNEMHEKDAKHSNEAISNYKIINDQDEEIHRLNQKVGELQRDMYNKANELQFESAMKRKLQTENQQLVGKLENRASSSVTIPAEKPDHEFLKLISRMRSAMNLVMRFKGEDRQNLLMRKLVQIEMTASVLSKRYKEKHDSSGEDRKLLEVFNMQIRALDDVLNRCSLKFVLDGQTPVLDIANIPKYVLKPTKKDNERIFEELTNIENNLQLQLLLDSSWLNK